MNREQGLNIQIELKRQGKTQRWLIEQLRESGIENVDEYLLSRMLMGRYPYRLGREVLAAAEKILGITQD